MYIHAICYTNMISLMIVFEKVFQIGVESIEDLKTWFLATRHEQIWTWHNPDPLID